MSHEHVIAVQHDGRETERGRMRGGTSHYTVLLSTICWVFCVRNSHTIPADCQPYAIFLITNESHGVSAINLSIELKN